MHRFKRYFAIGSCILLVGMTATGCSGSNSNSGTSTSPANNTSSPAPTNTVASDSTDTNKEYGKVTAIDGTSITLALVKETNQAATAQLLLVLLTAKLQAATAQLLLALLTAKLQAATAARAKATAVWAAMVSQNPVKLRRLPLPMKVSSK